jgi:hypothetical protein
LSLLFSLVTPDVGLHLLAKDEAGRCQSRATTGYVTHGAGTQVKIALILQERGQQLLAEFGARS